MPYVPLTAADIDAGSPTKEEIFQRIHDNMEFFDDEINDLQVVFKIDIFNLRFSGKLTQYTSSELNSFVPVYVAPAAGTIVNFVATLLTASTSGTLSIEIDKSTDDGVNWTPLLSTPVTLTGTTVGSQSGAVSFTSPAAQDFNQNDMLRIRFTTAQTGQGNFHISIYGES